MPSGRPPVGSHIGNPPDGDVLGSDPPFGSRRRVCQRSAGEGSTVPGCAWLGSIDAGRRMRKRWTSLGLRKPAAESSSRGGSVARAAAKPSPGYALTPGTRLQEFVIERVLGAGGFGLTYLARDASLDAWRAVKEYLPREWGVRRAEGVVRPRTERDAEDYQWGLERFLKEARLLAQFDHRHIIRVYRVFEAHGTAYLVMEYVDGRSLKDAIASMGGVMPDDAVRPILLSLTDGLAVVHEAGLLHRDIKPDNVMLRPDGMPVLIDFGSARQVMGRGSQPLTRILTPRYAPIEQYSPQGRQGPWTDIYALGAVAYVALSGQLPDTAPDRVRVDRLRPVAEAARRPVNAGLAAAVDAALAVNETDRPQTVLEWRAMLVDSRTESPAPRPVSPPAVDWEDAFGSQDGGMDDQFRATTYTVGRGPECRVRLSHASVSRHHADIVRLSDGQLEVMDCGSTNGTFVLSGQEWRAVRQWCLAPTDHVRFGEVEMTVDDLDAWCVEQDTDSSGRTGADVEDGGSGKLVRDPKTGEIVEKPSRRGRRR